MEAGPKRRSQGEPWRLGDGQDQRRGEVGSRGGQRQGDSLRTVDGVDAFHGFVKDERAGGGVESRQNALRLADRVGEQNAGAV